MCTMYQLLICISWILKVRIIYSDSEFQGILINTRNIYFIDW